MLSGGRLRSLVCDLRCPVLAESQREDQVKMLVHYLKLNRKKNNPYFFYFVICEIFNFVNVFVQIYLIDAFLGGVFLNYGLDVIKYSETDQEFRTDPMIKRFPRMTKCTFHRFGKWFTCGNLSISFVFSSLSLTLYLTLPN